VNTSGNRYSMSPIHLYFVLYVSLVGVGLMNFQYKMLRGAEKDGWISILAAAVLISIILKMMFVLLSRQSPGQSSLVHINQRYWGRIAGSVLNWIFILYFLSAVLGADCGFSPELDLYFIFSSGCFCSISLLYSYHPAVDSSNAK